MLSFLRKNKSHPLVTPLVLLSHFVKKSSGNSFCEKLWFWGYEKLCVFLYKERKNILSEQQVKFFNSHHVVVVPELIPSKDLESLIENANKTLADPEKLLTEDVLLDDNPSFLDRISDKIFSNADFFYRFPADHLTKLSYVSNPLLNVSGLSTVIRMFLQPATSQLMKSSAEIIRTWAYKTNNIDGQITPNHNGKLHLDGDINSSIKCIVYLNEVSEDNGPFCYLDRKTNKEIYVTGKAGTVIFFRSSKLLHKGTNTVNRERVCAAFLAHPSIKDKLPEYDLSPNFTRKTFPFLPLGKKAKLFKV